MTISQKVRRETKELFMSTPEIRNRCVLLSRKRSLMYWERKAVELAGQVDVLDPERVSMRDLRSEYPPGTKVYRASTGGKWGRSAEIVML